MIENKQIAIIGAGPGGLTLALLLKMGGAQVKVYEKQSKPDIWPQQETLDLHYESGLKAIKKAGLLGALKANYRKGGMKMRIVDSKGNIRFDDHDAAVEDDFESEFFKPEIDYGPLRQLLVASLDPETVMWDTTFDTMQRSGEGWKMNFANGSKVFADLVIGADGAQSKVRPNVTKVAKVYSGIMMVAGTIQHASVSCPKVNRLINGGKVFALGGENVLIIYSKAEDELTFYGSFRAAEDWERTSAPNFASKEGVDEWFEDEFRGWGKVWLELFADNNTVHGAMPQYYLPLFQPWASLPNVTLMGDAAHLMPPFAGEGVNMALLDALKLSEVLLSPSLDVPEAIKKYETQMRKHATVAAQTTLQHTEQMHGPAGLKYMLALYGG